MNEIITVTQLSTYLRSLVDGAAPLRDLRIRGEIFNFRRNFQNGNMYFTLREGECSIRCLIFSSEGRRLRFAPADGIMVVVRGRVALYGRDAACTVYVSEMAPDGTGAAIQAYRKIYEKLRGEGLFAEERKLPLPKFPRKAAVITSASAAALRDVDSVRRRRWPICEIVLFPVSVQGENAAGDIVRAFGKLSEDPDIEAVILTRGGGSAEDLWVFNDENAARAVAACRVPVICAVGHETDTTICDFAASVRAETPSAAAEKLFPDWKSVLSEFIMHADLIRAQVRRTLSQKTAELAGSAVCVSDIYDYLDARAEQTEQARAALLRRCGAVFSEKERRFAVECEKLSALSPLNVLVRGYCIAQKGEDPICSAAKAKEADDFDLVFKDGRVRCKTI